MLRAVSLLVFALLALRVDAEHVQAMIRRGAVKVRGVNLGSWLVPEYWMSYTSPAWKGVDKAIAEKGPWKALEALGHAKGDKQFDDHYKTWITKKDIAEIASYGLNTVRVPVGYWIVKGLPGAATTPNMKVIAPEDSNHVSSSLAYLDLLINNWALTYNVSVMLSLHCHEGSQNGFDNSAPVVFGERHWADSDANYQSSLQFASILADRYKKAPAFLGMDLMNEPNFSDDAAHCAKVRKYYERAYAVIRGTGNDCILVFSPNLAEQTPQFNGDYMRPPKFTNVWTEYHPYYKWSFDGKSEEYILDAANGYADGFLKPSVWKGDPVLIGEWCLDGPASGPFKDKSKRQEFGKTQLRNYEFAQAGWTFWSWRHDDEASTTSGWSMRQLLRQGDLVLPHK